VWIELCVEEDGLFTGNLNVGKAKRSLPHYESRREQFIVGGGSTGKKGGRDYMSNQEGPTITTRPVRKL
jgi:hypothetical protein